MSGNAAEALNNTPLLFSLNELEKCDTKTRQKLKLKYFEVPKNDNEKLFNLQKLFYDSKNDDDETKTNLIFWQMWQLTAKVAQRIIIKTVQARGLEFAPDEVADKVSDTCEYLLRRFKTYNNYFVSTNWIIAIRDSARHALDYQTKLDSKTVGLADFTVLNHAKIQNFSGRPIFEDNDEINGDF